MSLRTELKGAKVVMKDKKRGYTLAWFGGHGIHGYDKSGKEKFFWNTGDFSKDHADEDEIKKDIKEEIQTGNYIQNYGDGEG